jgi:hypothetical protein
LDKVDKGLNGLVNKVNEVNLVPFWIAVPGTRPPALRSTFECVTLPDGGLNGKGGMGKMVAGQSTGKSGTMEPDGGQ